MLPDNFSIQEAIYTAELTIDQAIEGWMYEPPVFCAEYISDD